MTWMMTKQNRFNPALVFILTVCIFFSLLKSADAHRVIVFAWVEGNTVFVESKFNGGKKVKNGKVTVTDARGVELLCGITDDNGEFSFRVPKRAELKIILDAGAGHRGEWKIPLEEVEAVTTRSGNLNQKGPTAKDVFAGIGYIVGLVGIVAYLNSRRKKSHDF